MSRDYDAQLLESVSVRRRRLQNALLWGPLRQRRDYSDGLTRAASGAILTAVLCAGCVGWGFLQHALSHQHAAPTIPTAPASPASSMPSMPAPSR